MMCFKHLMLFSLLLPVPTASPIFLALFSMAVFWSVRPCGYCLALFSILFLTTSPSSTFVSTLTPTPTPSEPNPPISPSASAAAPASTGETGESCRLTDAVPGRSWLDLNGGRIMDPVLWGYKRFGALSEPTASSTLSRSDTQEAGSKWMFWRAASESETNDEQQPSRAEGDEEGQTRLPWGYFDLSFRGIGFVFDFNPTRTEEGIAWEIEDARRARTRSALQSASMSSTSTGQAEEPEKTPALLTDPPADTGWVRVPFLGSW